MNDGIQTCSESLFHAGTCCIPDCNESSVEAVLMEKLDELVEHAMCKRHAATVYSLGRKPLVWDDDWKPA